MFMRDKHSAAKRRLSQFWTPARFLLVGSFVLLVLGSLGAAGILKEISPAN